MLTGDRIQNHLAPVRDRLHAGLAGLHQRFMSRTGRADGGSLRGNRIRHSGDWRLSFPFEQVRDELHHPLVQRQRVGAVNHAHRTGGHVLAMVRHPHTILAENLRLRVAGQHLVARSILGHALLKALPTVRAELRPISLDENVSAVGVEVGVRSNAHENKMWSRMLRVKTRLTCSGPACRGLQSDCPRRCGLRRGRLRRSSDLIPTSSPATCRARSRKTFGRS
jgi:hypothetical protein